MLIIYRLGKYLTNICIKLCNILMLSLMVYVKEYLYLIVIELVYYGIWLKEYYHKVLLIKLDLLIKKIKINYINVLIKINWKKNILEILRIKNQESIGHQN
jgi:hypothetical protein